MAIYGSGLWWAAAALLLAVPYTYCLEVKRGDVTYNRIAQILYLTRTLEDKLERHEQRDRLLGEQIKKLLTTLEKHQSEMQGTVSRLDDRLATVETTIMQMDGAQKKIQQTLDELKPSLKASTEFNNKMNEYLQRRFDATDAKLEAFSREITTIKDSVSPDLLQGLCPEITTDTSPFEKAISDSEKLLNKFEQKLSEYNTTAANATQASSALLSEVAAADEAKHIKITEDLEHQGNEISKIQRMLSEAESMWKDLPRLADLKLSTNQTLEAINTATETIITNENTHANGIQAKVDELGEKLEQTNATIQQTLAETINNLLEALAMMNAQIGNLPSSNSIQPMMDNVIFIRKRVENSLSLLTNVVKEVRTGNQKSDDLKRLANNQSLILDKESVLLEGISNVLNVTYPLLMFDHDMITNITSTAQHCNDNSNTSVSKLDEAVTEIMKELKDLEKLITKEANELQANIKLNSLPPMPVPGPRPSPGKRI